MNICKIQNKIQPPPSGSIKSSQAVRIRRQNVRNGVRVHAPLWVCPGATPSIWEMLSN